MRVFKNLFKGIGFYLVDVPKWLTTGEKPTPGDSGQGSENSGSPQTGGSTGTAAASSGYSNTPNDSDRPSPGGRSSSDSLLEAERGEIAMEKAQIDYSRGLELDRTLYEGTGIDDRDPDGDGDRDD
jgi:hypothetical protein